MTFEEAIECVTDLNELTLDDDYPEIREAAAMALEDEGFSEQEIEEILEKSGF